MAVFARLPLDVLVQVQDYGRFAVVLRNGRFMGRIAADDIRYRLVARILLYYTWLHLFATIKTEEFIGWSRFYQFIPNYVTTSKYSTRNPSYFDRPIYAKLFIRISFPRCAKLLLSYFNYWRDLYVDQRLNFNRLWRLLTTIKNNYPLRFSADHYAAFVRVEGIKETWNVIHAETGAALYAFTRTRPLLANAA